MAEYCGVLIPVDDLPTWLANLPAVNASLNALATCLLVYGWWLIRHGQRERHRKIMLTAFGTSAVFLVCYLVYHVGLHQITGQRGRPFQGQGMIRPIYFTLLISHVLLAASVPVLAIIAIVRGLRERWESHRRIGRIAMPIWLYVSVTGVVIYFMLYHWPVDPT